MTKSWFIYLHNCDCH